MLFVYILAAALYEEIVFRGLGFQLVAWMQLPVTAGVVGLALIFGMQHTAGGWTSVVYSMGFGLFFSVLYLTADSLIAPVVAHAAGNAHTVLWIYPRLLRRLGAQPAPSFLF